MKKKILTGLVIFSTLLLPSGMSVGRAEDPLLFATHCYQEPANPKQRSKSIGCVNDNQNNAYVAGIHYGIHPIASFLNVYSPGGTLLYSTQLKAQDTDITVTSIFMDREQNIWLVGNVTGHQFPMEHPWATLPEDESNLFFMKYSPDRELLFSTLWGGNGKDTCQHVKMNTKGQIVVSGITDSTDMLLGKDGESIQAPERNFVMVINQDGQSDSYRCFSDRKTSIRCMGLFEDGRIVLAGQTSDSSLPVKEPLQQSLKGEQDGFFMVLDTQCQIERASYFGGEGQGEGKEQDEITSLSINLANQAVSFTGVTDSESLPVPIPSPVIKGNREEDPAIKKNFKERGFIVTFQKDFILLRSTYLYDIHPIDLKTGKLGNMYVLSDFGKKDTLHPFYQHQWGDPDSSGASIHVLLPTYLLYHALSINASHPVSLCVNEMISQVWLVGSTEQSMYTFKGVQPANPQQEAGIVASFQLKPTLSRSRKMQLQNGDYNEWVMVENTIYHELIEQSLFLHKNRTYVPPRVFSNFEKIKKMEYFWAELQRWTIENDEKIVELVESNNKVTIQYKDSPDHKETVLLDSPAYLIVSGRSVIVLRFVAKTFGLEVEWEPVEQRILVSWEGE